MTNDQETRDKYNFLTWYTTASREDIEKARYINEKKYEDLLKKYAHEVEKINLRKKL